MRSRTLFATLVATLALPAAAAQAAPQLVASYDLRGDGAATYASTVAGRNLVQEGAPVFGEADVNGLVRPVGRLAAGQGYAATLSSSAVLTSAYTVALGVDVVDETVEQRLLSLRGKTSARGLWVKDGRLEYRAAEGTTTGTHPIPADFTQVVVTRDAANLVSVYLDGALDLSFTDVAADAEVLSVRVGNVDATGAGVLDVARLRLAKGAATAAEAAALAPFDAAAPDIDVEAPWEAGGTRYAGPNAQWRGAVFDDSDPEADVRVRIEDAEGDVVVAEHDAVSTYPGRGAFGLGRVHDGWWSEPGGTFVHGAAYALVVRATDFWGKASETRLPFVADTQKPATSIDAPPVRVSDRTPVFTGAGGTALGDDGWVSLQVCAGSCLVERGIFGGNGNEVAWDEAEIVGGRWTSRELAMQDEEGDQDIPLPDGAYTLRAQQWDTAGNVRIVERPFVVGDPLPPEEQPREDTRSPSGGGTPPPPPAPPVTTPPTTPRAVPSLPSATAVLGRLASRVGQSLRARGLKGLGAGVPIALAPERPGTVAVVVLDAAKRRTLASGTLRGRTLRVAATRAGRKALRGKRRLAVVVRTTFTPAGGAAVRSDARLTLRR